MDEVLELKNELKDIKDLLFSLGSSLIVMKSSYNLIEWLEKYIEIEKKGHVSLKTLNQYASDIEKYIRPNIDLNKSISDYVKMDFLELLNKVPTYRLKRNVYNLLNGAFRSAKENNILEKNFMASVKMPAQETKTGRALTIKEQRSLLRYVKGSSYENLFKLYLLTGCRKSELLKIKWSDVDFENNFLHIKGTKTRKSDRFIPLFPQAKIILKEMKRDSRSDNIFSITVNSLNCYFRRLKKKKKLTYNIHSFRHTFATRCLEQSISMKVVQKWLGHSNLNTTSGIYTHVQSNFERKESQKFNIDFK